MHMDFELWHQKINSRSRRCWWPHFCHYLIPLLPELAGWKVFQPTKGDKKAGIAISKEFWLRNAITGGSIGGHTQTDACNQKSKDVEWGLRGLLRLYWVRACFGCLLVPKVLALKSACTNVYVSCCNLECTLRSMPGGCAYGVSPTSLLIPEYQGRARVPRKGQWACPRKIYGKPTEGGILAPPPPQFEARPNLFPHILNISMEIAMFNFYYP